MIIARVVGSAVSTIKTETLIGSKLLIIREADVAGKPTGRPLVAVDSVGAGVGDLVLAASGSSARQTPITENRPVDTVIMAILDSLQVEGTVTYRKEAWR